jgi:hypothetical protein
MSASPADGQPARREDPADHFLCRAQRQRGICGNLAPRARRRSPRFLPGRHEAVDDPEGLSLHAADEPSGEEHVFAPRQVP